MLKSLYNYIVIKLIVLSSTKRFEEREVKVQSTSIDEFQTLNNTVYNGYVYNVDAAKDPTVRQDKCRSSNKD
ncbi:10309_t:CDS:2 [Funneliformis caledonium]|uniref:10309_t:CDS:1 n=1 Tax=Funneliformis caledonium TaxID=1117310 RepID=A0A9N8UZD1_9GLOM|nr:10309_t:CDS:2 [Funneliformis caledonium]